jgi:hypothetical protein
MQIQSLLSRRNSSVLVQLGRIKHLNASVAFSIHGREFSSGTPDGKFGLNTKDLGMTIAKSSGWLLGGLAIAHQLPYGTPTAVSIFIYAYFATRASQPFVNTKLAAQRATPIQHKNLIDFLKHELTMFTSRLKEVGCGQYSHAGGNIYALRGSVAKMMTFAGFEAVYGVVSVPLLAMGIPIPIVIALSGFMGGFFQGTLISVPEYLSTLQSRYPTKKNSELFVIMWESIKASYGLPVGVVSLRNGLFDMTFNTMRVGFDVHFGPSAVLAMTLNYPVERYRSLIHQNELRKLHLPETSPSSSSSSSSGGDNSKNNSSDSSSSSSFKFDYFQGWFSKAVEFFVIYQTLQVFKSKEMKPEVRKEIEQTPPEE